jgi:hypothetical protein
VKQKTSCKTWERGTGRRVLGRCVFMCHCGFCKIHENICLVYQKTHCSSSDHRITNTRTGAAPARVAGRVRGGPPLAQAGARFRVLRLTLDPGTLKIAYGEVRITRKQVRALRLGAWCKRITSRLDQCSRRYLFSFLGSSPQIQAPPSLTQPSPSPPPTLTQNLNQLQPHARRSPR